MNKQIIELSELLNLDISDYINDLEVTIIEQYLKEYKFELYFIINNINIYFIKKIDFNLIIKKLEKIIKEKATNKQIYYLSKIYNRIPENLTKTKAIELIRNHKSK